MVKITFVQDGAFFEVKSNDVMIHPNFISVKTNNGELEYKHLPNSLQKELQYTFLPGSIWCEIPYEEGVVIKITSI